MNHEIAQKIAQAVLEHLTEYRTAHSGRRMLADVIEHAWLSAQEDEDAAKAREAADKARQSDLLNTIVSITQRGAKL